MRAAALLLSLLAAPAAAAEPNPLAPMDFLVGSCWDGTFADPGAGMGKKDVRCFTRMYGGKYVRDVHQVDRGPYGGETIYAWDPTARRIAYTDYASDGGVSRGTMEARDGGLVFGDAHYKGPDGKDIMLRSLWLRDGADAYTAVTQQKVGDGWRDMMKITFKRLPTSELVLKPQ